MDRASQTRDDHHVALTVGNVVVGRGVGDAWARARGYGCARGGEIETGVSARVEVAIKPYAQVLTDVVTTGVLAHS